MSKKKKAKKAGKRKAGLKKPRAKKPLDPVVEPKPLARQPIDDKTAHEGIRHVMGANPPKGGQQIDADEEDRRLSAMRIEVERLAKRFGLDVRPTVTYTPEETRTERAKDIKELAGPQMAEAASRIAVERTKIKVKDARGRSIEFSRIRLEAEGKLAASLKEIATFFSSAFRGAIGLSVKVGSWFKAKLVGKAEGD